MAFGGHLEKKIKNKLRIDLKWREMHSKVIFGHPKWSPAAILWNKNLNQSCVLIWNGEKCDKSCVFIWNGEKCDQKMWFSVIRGYTQYLPLGKYTNSSYTMLLADTIILISQYISHFFSCINFAASRTIQICTCISKIVCCYPAIGNAKYQYFVYKY